MGNNASQANEQSMDAVFSQLQKSQRTHSTATEVQSRTVFVSCWALHQTWRKVPVHVLLSAIILLPMQRSWLYDENLSKLMNAHHHLLYNKSNALFLKLLRFKDAQRLVFWMADEYDDQSVVGPAESESDSDEVYHAHSFWQFFSRELSKLHDPKTNRKYRPLNLRKAHWIERCRSGNYASMTESIEYQVLIELHFNIMWKFSVVREILIDANPHLHVVCAYKDPISVAASERQNRKFIHCANAQIPRHMLEGDADTAVDVTKGARESPGNGNEDEEDSGGEFWISEDYFSDM